MPYNDTEAKECIDRLEHCRTDLRQKLKEIDDTLGLLMEVKTVIISPEKTEVQLVDNDGVPEHKMVTIPAVTDIPVDSRTFEKFTKGERDKIFTLAKSKCDQICSKLEKL